MAHIFGYFMVKYIKTSSFQINVYSFNEEKLDFAPQTRRGENIHESYENGFLRISTHQ